MSNMSDRKAAVSSFLKGPVGRFGVVGASLTLLDLFLYQLLANALQVSFMGLPAAVCAVWVGTPIIILINFFISHRFVWRSTASKRKTIIPFFSLNLTTGLVVQPVVIGLVLWAVDALAFTALDPWLINILAKCIAAGVGMILNFLGAKHLFDG